jgi:hypothetical protein
MTAFDGVNPFLTLPPGAGAGLVAAMFDKVKRLFTITNRFEAFLLIYALALGACERGIHYLHTYPGFFGTLLFLACTGSVFIAGGMVLDNLALRRNLR